MELMEFQYLLLAYCAGVMTGAMMIIFFDMFFLQPKRLKSIKGARGL